MTNSAGYDNKQHMYSRKGNLLCSLTVVVKGSTVLMDTSPLQCEGSKSLNYLLLFCHKLNSSVVSG